MLIMLTMEIFGAATKLTAQVEFSLFFYKLKAICLRTTYLILCLPIISLFFKCHLYSELEIPNVLS